MPGHNPTRKPLVPRFLLLLVSLVLMLLVGPQLETNEAGRFTIRAFLLFVFVSALMANRQRPIVFYTGIGLGAAAMTLTVLSDFVQSPAVFAGANVLAAPLLVMSAVMILITVFEQHMATHRAILGAICSYLLLGLAWAMIYSVIEAWNPVAFAVQNRTTWQPFVGSPELTSFRHLVYYSFVTMSTLGFGDIVPLSPAAQTLSWMQAVTGQFYLAVLVARLVSAMPVPAHPGTRGRSGGPGGE